MIHLYDSAQFATIPTLDVDPKLKALLTDRAAALTPELLAHTEYLVVHCDDTEADIVRHLGFSPLVEPIDGGRFGGRAFHPHWDWLADHGGWFEMIVTFGSTFAYVLFIEDRADELGRLCRHFSRL